VLAALAARPAALPAQTYALKIEQDGTVVAGSLRADNATATSLRADNATVVKDLTVNNNATVVKDLTVNNNATVVKDLTVNNDLTVKGTLEVESITLPLIKIVFDDAAHARLFNYASSMASSQQLPDSIKTMFNRYASELKNNYVKIVQNPTLLEDYFQNLRCLPTDRPDMIQPDLFRYEKVGTQKLPLYLGWSNDTRGYRALIERSNAPSDVRLKADVARIGGALARLRRIGGVTYRWNELGLEYLTRDAAEGVSAGPGATPEQDRALRQRIRAQRRDELAGTHVGVLAQEVEAALPQAVSTGAAGFKQVRYQDLIPLLIEAAREQDEVVRDQARALQERSETVARQQQRIERLEAEIAGLRSSLARLDQLETRLTRFERAAPPDGDAPAPAVATPPRAAD
jgi:hypothetical protein